ncbi:hypothetical protein ZYGR_0U02770 [Zygosaccharomyces rouxii]|uniref:Uncharacterized protein n=1 Tax=Zygosaccharomyces rouxii TaxID=4956 RepID=A0A1Q3A3X6_ZYGRO|nr:hypothetical protein ZYGR_0U02770 [Zygosaccharomyces rouxii]
MFEIKFRIPIPVQDGNQLCCSKFAPNGKSIAIGIGDHVLVYDLETPPAPPRIVLTQHSKPISEICWSPDGQCIATASDNFTVGITHLSYGPLHRLVSHTAPVVSLAFNPKGNLLCSSSMDESIKIWDVLNGSLMRTIAAHSESVVSVDIPQLDSTILSSGSYDGLIRVFDMASGHCLKTLTYDKDWQSETGVVPISQVKFSQNARYLLVKSLDGIVKIWDCIRGDVVRTFKIEPSQERQLQRSCGMDFLYPSDGSAPIVVSGYEDGKIYCWDSATKKLLQLIDGETHSGNPVMSIHCYGETMCSLSLNGDCYAWKWTCK